jgi:hypothetical protein
LPFLQRDIRSGEAGKNLVLARTYHAGQSSPRPKVRPAPSSEGCCLIVEDERRYYLDVGGKPVLTIRAVPACILEFLGYCPYQPARTVMEPLAAVRTIGYRLNRKEMASRTGVDETSLWQWENDVSSEREELILLFGTSWRGRSYVRAAVEHFENNELTDAGRT